jgi:hypothetical protein
MWFRLAPDSAFGSDHPGNPNSPGTPPGLFDVATWRDLVAVLVRVLVPLVGGSGVRER